VEAPVDVVAGTPPEGGKGDLVRWADRALALTHCSMSNGTR